MNNQREKNWNLRYLNSDTPWEDSKPKYGLKDIFSRYCQRGTRVLEIGCGLGTNAHFLAKLGYNVSAIDISQKAIELASNKFVHKNLEFLCQDFSNAEFKRKFDVVFDKGCMHSYTQQESYNKFAESVSRVLTEDGVWINISGNADNPDNLEKRRLDEYPRMSLTAIALAIEPFFEIQEIKNTRYGEEVNFMAWTGVFKKRNFFLPVNQELNQFMAAKKQNFKILFLGPEEMPLINWLRKQGNNVIQTTDKISVGFLQQENFDFLISYGYRHIIKKTVLDKFPSRAINLHISYLPFNRGADPNFWSFIENSPKGVTIHYLDEGVDTGDIIVQKKVNFDSDGETLATTYQKLHQEIQILFKNNWLDIKKGTCNRFKQASGGSEHKIKDRQKLEFLLENGWNTPVKILQEFSNQ